MSMDSMDISYGGRQRHPLTVSLENSSVGSNESQTVILNHPGLRTVPTSSHSVGHSVYHPEHNQFENQKATELARLLVDPRYPTETLFDYKAWEIDLRKLEVGETFAHGAFGMLYRGTYDGEDVAIKLLVKVDNNPETQPQLMEQQFMQEVMMLSNLKHPNIVRFIGACRKSMLWCIVTEYAKGGSLRQFLMKRQNKPIPLKLAVRHAIDIARGMAYVHGLGFIHRDLKSDNILIAADKTIKIADFGVARIEVTNEWMTPETGTYRWMAPEMIQHRPYNQKVDVYSFGIVLWELVTAKLPFHDMTPVKAAFAVVNGNIRPAIPQECLPTLRQIMTRCWHVDPNVRPPFSEVIRLLEGAEVEIMDNVRKARFRCCISEPMTLD